MSEENAGGETFTAEEQAFISSRGETPLPGTSEAVSETQPEPQAQAEAAGEEDEADAQPEQGKRRDFVAEIKKEREKRKAFEEKLRALEVENANFRGKMEILAKAGQQPEAEPVAPPTWDEDVFAAGAHLETEVKSLKEQLQQQERARVMAEHENRLLSWTSQAENQFKATQPDFDDAAKHLFDARMGVMQDLGMPEHIAKEALRREFLGVIDLCARNNENPAAKVYAMAKRFGYAPKGKAEADPMAKLEQVERSQSSHKSLSAGSPAASGDMTPEKLIAMSEDDFLAYSQKYPKTVRRLMGG